MNETIAIVLAAGSGKRMHSSEKKQYMDLNGKPILYYSLRAMADSFMDGIIVVTNPAEREYVQTQIVEKYDIPKVLGYADGGAERYHSVAAGLEAAAALSDQWKYCFIHDSARPFVTEEILGRALDTVKREHACAVGMPVKDTIKIADEHGYVAQTPNRSSVWAVQTPQVFDFELALDAYRQLLCREAYLLDHGVQITDDAMVVETLTDRKVKLVEGSYNNIKITTPEDLPLAERIIMSMNV